MGCFRRATVDRTLVLAEIGTVSKAPRTLSLIPIARGAWALRMDIKSCDISRPTSATTTFATEICRRSRRSRITVSRSAFRLALAASRLRSISRTRTLVYCTPPAAINICCKRSAKFSPLSVSRSRFAIGSVESISWTSRRRLLMFDSTRRALPGISGCGR